MYRSKESTKGPISNSFAGASIWTVQEDEHIPTKRMGNRVHLLVKSPVPPETHSSLDGSRPISGGSSMQLRPAPPLANARQPEEPTTFRNRIVCVGAQEAREAEQLGQGEGLLDPDREFIDALDAVLHTKSIDMVIEFASDISDSASGAGRRPLTEDEINALISSEAEARNRAGSKADDSSDDDDRQAVDEDDESDQSDEEDGMETPDEAEEANTARAMEVRTPVDVPLELLPVGQQHAILKADNEIRKFADEDEEFIPRRRKLQVNWYTPAASWKVQQGIEHTMLHQSPWHDPSSGIQLGRALLEAREHEKKPRMKKIPREDMEMTLKSAKNEEMLQAMDSARSFKDFLLQDRSHVPHFLERCHRLASPESSSPRHETPACNTPRLPEIAQRSPRLSSKATPRRGVEANR